MLCPNCGADQSIVLDTVPKSDYIRRRRKCLDCNHRWTTFEVEGRKVDRYYTAKCSISKQEKRTKKERIKYHVSALYRLTMRRR